MTLSDSINELLKPVDTWINDYPGTYLWYIAFAVIISAGLLFLWKFKAMQITTLPEQMRMLVPSPEDKRIRHDKGRMISSFQTFCVGMGGRVGIGNITGVTTAILMGGAGAVFWMWMFALLGACTSFVECTLAQIFKEKKSDGNFHGGPAYYIEKGLRNHKFAAFIAFWTIVTYGVGFIANEAANSASAFTQMEVLSDIDGINIIMALIFAGLTASLIFGGIRRIARASEYIVPVMVVIWLGIGITAIILNIDKFGWAIGEIANNAFDFRTIFGGFAGSCIMWGVKRGIFSNDSGIGFVPCLAASANVEHPVRQGMIQSIGVLIDTIVVCSITAFMVLCALGEGTFAHSGAMSAVQDAMSTAFDGNWILWILAIFLSVFAFTSLMADFSVSEANLRFIADRKSAVTAFRISIVAIVFVACIIPVDMVWDICDVFLAVMAVLNIVSLFMLFRYVLSVYDDYRKQKKEGVDTPVFDSDKWDSRGLDKSGVTAWSGRL